MDPRTFPRPGDQDPGQPKRLALVVYLLQAASFLFGITYIAAVAINYLKWPEVAGTWVETHFRWQVKTFWYSLLWGVVGGVTTFLGVGYLILLANAIWIVYRIVVGWMALSADRPIS